MGVDGVFARKGGGGVIVNLRLRDVVSVHMRLCGGNGVSQAAGGGDAMR